MEFSEDHSLTCMKCGFKSNGGFETLPARRVLRGRRFGPPDRCEPDEYESYCPDCGATDQFEPSILCAECEEYPCVCCGQDF